MKSKDVFYDTLSSRAEFQVLVSRKRAASLFLFGMAMAAFFSIPLVSSQFPGFFKMRIFGGVNVGLLYLLAQYVMGGLIAWRYAVVFAGIDKEMSMLVSEFARKD
ncbi:DUF485 domain-containing protein [Methyloversatilis discipulorum]|uniref:DUF485 domain-containing protein n=1 Tax=Methyloversatilis discipulorum TaxID=1119528 RepID=UPI001A44C57B|nr:DUF485 domain-containing protein [Methyloversatilis discipulorum]MBL8468826.1 DUF485 domain-containing protein [Methyloversatilis discipulorum]